MSTQIKVIFNKLPAIQAALRPRASQAIRKSLLDAQGWIRQDMAQGKGGRMYGAHQASAPGETPAVDTGTLSGSLTVENVHDLHGELSAGGAGIYQELGTVKMAPRPFLQPAAVRIAPGLEQAIKAIVEGSAL